jgi:hypothetical protein
MKFIVSVPLIVFGLVGLAAWPLMWIGVLVAPKHGYDVAISAAWTVVFLLFLIAGIDLIRQKD